MTTARVVAVYFDGTKHEAVGSFMALSDRVHFERRYNLSVLEMQRQSDLLSPDCKAAGNVTDLREERMAYFAWKTLVRGDPAVGDFEAFVDSVDDLSIERLDGPVDPTVEVPQPGMLPS